MKNKLIYLFTDARVRNKKNANLILFIYLFIYVFSFIYIKNRRNMWIHNKINLIYFFIH
jgi:hypothetical protein